MSVKAVRRPVVRSFKQKYIKEAAAHVRAGGHAVIWDSAKRKCTLVFPHPEEGVEDDFGLWAVYDMGKWKWKTGERGVLKGLASTPVARDCFFIVKRRAERDSIHKTSTRKVAFDCTKCAACCRDNEVILQESDIKRFEDAGRGELAKPPYAKRHRDGRVILTLLSNKRCRHLRRDNRCGIYSVRPYACSEFPMGSECCLFAREDVLGLLDGLAPEESN